MYLFIRISIHLFCSYILKPYMIDNVLFISIICKYMNEIQIYIRSWNIEQLFIEVTEKIIIVL